MYERVLRWLVLTKSRWMGTGRIAIAPIFRKHLGTGFAFSASVFLPVELPENLASSSNWLICRFDLGSASPKPTLPSLVLGDSREAHDAKLFRLSDLGDGTYAAIVHFNRQPTVEVRVSTTATATNDELRIEFARLDSLTARAFLAVRMFSELISVKESPSREVAKDLGVFSRMVAREGKRVVDQAKDIVLGVTPFNVVEPLTSSVSDYEKWFFCRMLLQQR